MFDKGHLMGSQDGEYLPSIDANKGALGMSYFDPATLISGSATLRKYSTKF